MAWLVGVMDHGRWGARIPTVLTIILYCLSWWMLSWRIPARGASAGISVIGVLWPPYWVVLGTLWKDVWFAMSLLSAVAVAWLLTPRWPWAALGVVFAGGCTAALLRYNGITATLPLLGVMAVGVLCRQQGHWSRRWGGTMTILLAHVGAVAVLNVGIATALRVVATSPQQAIFLLDLAGLSVRVGRNLYPLPPNSRVPVEKIRQSYYLANTPSVDTLVGSHAPLKWARDKQEVDALTTAWRAAIRQYPWPYLQHRALVFARQFALVGPDVCYPYEPVSEYRSYPSTAKWHELAYTPGWVGQAVWAGVTELDPLFAGWPYLLVCAGVSCVCVFRRPFPVFAGAVSLSGLSYGLGYFFVAVACESRYHYWTAIAAGLSIVLLLVETTAKEIRRPSVSA